MMKPVRIAEVLGVNIYCTTYNEGKHAENNSGDNTKHAVVAKNKNKCDCLWITRPNPLSKSPTNRLHRTVWLPEESRRLKVRVCEFDLPAPDTTAVVVMERKIIGMEHRRCLCQRTVNIARAKFLEQLSIKNSECYSLRSITASSLRGHPRTRWGGTL